MRSDETDPKEQAAGKLTWVSRPLYKAVGELYIDLSKNGNRTEVINLLREALASYENAVLSVAAVRVSLYHTFNDLEVKGLSVSTLSQKYNMSMKGHNAKLKKDMQSVFDQASHEEFVLGNPNTAASLLKGAGLNHKVLFSAEIKGIVKDTGGAAVTALSEVTVYRNTLFKSTLKMVMQIARNHSRSLDGSVVEWQDLVQEGVIAALQAVESYHPEPDDGGATFTSYVYTTVRGIISKRVNETTRTVRIPRWNINRFAHVSKAIEELHLSVSDLRGGAWQDGKLYIGKVSDETLDKIALKATEIQNGTANFTAKEVIELLMVTQVPISMDVEVASDNDITEAITFGESITYEGPSTEELIDGMRLGHRLMELVTAYTVSSEEVKIMELRWGMGEVSSYREVAATFADGTGNAMNKGKAAAIEEQVMERIRRAMANDPAVARQFRELLRSTDLIPEN